MHSDSGVLVCTLSGTHMGLSYDMKRTWTIKRTVGDITITSIVLLPHQGLATQPRIAPLAANGIQRYYAMLQSYDLSCTVPALSSWLEESPSQAHSHGKPCSRLLCCVLHVSYCNTSSEKARLGTLPFDRRNRDEDTGTNCISQLLLGIR